MESPAQPSMLPHLWKSALATGVLVLILGILILWRPGAAILITAIFFGAYLLVTGVAQVVLAFSLKSSLGGRLLLFISGAAALVLAVLCFVNISESFLLLAIWIGVGFIFRGVATLTSAVADPTLPGRVWEILVGVFSLIAGAIMFVWPIEGLVALTQVTGWILIFFGAFEIVSSFAIRKASTNAGGPPSPPPAPPTPPAEAAVS